MLYTNKVNLMDEYLGFALFFLIFIAVYTLLNYFVLSQFFKLFSIEKTYWFYILLAVLALSYILAAGLETRSNNGLFRSIYIFAAVWMGVLFLLFCSLLIYFVANKIVPMTAWIAGSALLCIVLLVSIYGIINAYHFKVNEINISTDKNISLRVAQISDVHLGPINSEAYLKRIVDNLNKLDPDVVLITGDLFDGRYHYDKKVLSILNEINATIYFSSGNHDDYANLSVVKELLKDTKVKWLRNELEEYKGAYIIGLDDTRDAKSVGARVYALNMEHNLSKKYTILMNHRPIGWKDAGKYVDLMLSGHTHAGQIWPFTYLVFLEGNPTQGIHRIPDNKNFMLYINSGTGTWGPPMRIGTHTEITVFNIKSNNQGK